MVVVGAVMVVDVPAWDMIGCVVGRMVGAVVVVGVRGLVVVSSGGSTSIAWIGVSVGPSPRFFGTGLIVYHLCYDPDTFHFFSHHDSSTLHVPPP